MSSNQAQAIPVTFTPTSARREPPSRPPARRRRVAPPGLVAKAKLARFFAQLAVKEHLAPRLHVRPLVAELFLTDNCNLKCTSCACWRSLTHHELTTNEWMYVIDQCVDLGLVKLNFTGGEPLLRRDAARLIAHARDAGVPSLHLNTNAILLDAARRAELLAAGVRSFNISVDGPDAAVHDAVRGIDGSFARTVANLRALLDERRHTRVDVRLNFTVLRTNVAALPDIARLAQELGVQLYLNLGTDTTFLFRHQEVTSLTDIDHSELHAALRELDALARRDRRGLPRYSDRRYIERHFDDLLQRDLPCAESQLKLMIHSTGEVGGCWGHDPTRNVRERTLREIVDGPDYRAEHARLFRKECVGCGSNYSLNLRWRPRTYLQDLAWRMRPDRTWS
jgi:MoaA/NifB/PqqE/SkfB family radical SAM enzyme